MTTGRWHKRSIPLLHRRLHKPNLRDKHQCLLLLLAQQQGCERPLTVAMTAAVPAWLIRSLTPETVTADEVVENK
jgi:hypothetical protein